MDGKWIVGIGELLWDLFPDSRRPGGAPANVVYHAAQLGNRAALISRVGNDSDGRELATFLKKKGIKTDHLQVDKKQPTGSVLVEIGPDGDPSYTITRPVAWDYLEWNRTLAEIAGKADAIVFGTLAQRNGKSAETIRRFIRSAGKKTLSVLDLNLRPGAESEEVILASLEMADILKINRTEWDKLQDILETRDPETLLLEKFQVSGICLTLGESGSRWIDRDKSIEQPAFLSEPGEGDAVGLGDAFTAIMTSELLQGSSPKRALERASRYASILAGKRGGMPEMSAQEIRSRFDEHE